MRQQLYYTTHHREFGASYSTYSTSQYTTRRSIFNFIRMIPHWEMDGLDAMLSTQQRAERVGRGNMVKHFAGDMHSVASSGICEVLVYMFVYIWNFARRPVGRATCACSTLQQKNPTLKMAYTIRRTLDAQRNGTCADIVADKDAKEEEMCFPRGKTPGAKLELHFLII